MTFTLKHTRRAACVSTILLACYLLNAPVLAAVGRTEAIADVGVSGEAEYSIPIRATPGIGRVTPDLAITYGGPTERTILGVGFRLSGLSVITPCRKTIAQDLNAAPILVQAGDRYCVDGARLRSVGGNYGESNATYQAEIDRTLRATSLGSSNGIPGWFVVEAGDGLKYEYGNTTDSKLLGGTGAGAPPQFWAVNKITDRAGNYLVINYDTDNATRRFRPDYIEYTGGPGGAAHYRVQFVYQATDQPGPSQDITPSATGTATHVDARLLDRIELKLDNSTYRQYVFTYQSGAGSNQRLWKVTECADSVNDCFVPIELNWQSATSGHDAPVDGTAVGLGFIPMDYNGDGREDLVWASGSGYWYRMAGTANGYGDATPVGAQVTNANKAVPLEFDGDGFMDLLVDWSDGKWRILRGNATGFDSPIPAGSGGIPSNTSSNAWWVADVNGDGRDDLLHATYTFPAAIYVRLNSDLGFGGETLAFYDATLKFSGNPFVTMSGYGRSSIRKPDFNGDGRTDVLLRACIWDTEVGYCIAHFWYYALSNGTNFANQGNLQGSTHAASPMLADFNNDSLTDIAFPAPNSSAWCIVKGQGAGTLSRTCGPSTSGTELFSGLIADHDADGYSDLYLFKPATGLWDVYRGTGTGISSTPLVAGLSLGGATMQGLVVTDFNGDGLHDITGYLGGAYTWRTLRHTGSVGEVLLGASDAFSNAVSFTYLPMTNSTVYTKGSGGYIYPNKDVQYTTPLVRTMQISPFGGTPYTLTYSYADARVHVAGRSFLGMDTRVIVDERNGVKTTESYRQDFPHIGSLTQILVSQPDGTTILNASHTYAHWQLSFVSGKERYLPYRSQTVTRRYEVGGGKNGNEVTRTTENRTVSLMGNASFVSIQVVDKDAGSPTFGETYLTQITSTYKEDSGAWCIPVPTSRSERRIWPDNSDETRAMSWTVDGAACRVTKEVIEPTGAPNISLTTDFGYDSCGNVAQILTYPSSDITQTRTTTIDFGTRCQRPQSVTNPEAHSAQLAYDWRFARPSNGTDPNGLITTTEYDSFGRVTHVLRPDGTGARFAITLCDASNSWCGKDGSIRYKVTQTERDTQDAILRTDEQFYDGFGRVRFSHGDSLESGPAIVQTVYDAFGRVQSRSAPRFVASSQYITTFGYDMIGRPSSQNAPISEGSPTGRLTSIVYEGRDIKITDPRGKLTTRSFNALGELRTVVDPLPGGTTNYAHRPFGELASITDAANNVSSWTYSVRGFPIQSIDPDAGTWVYDYNAFGEQIHVRDAKTTAPAWTNTYTYDKLSRPKKRVETEGDTDWTWGNSATEFNKGLLKSIMSPGGYKEEYVYDNKSRPLEQKITADGTPYYFNQAYDDGTGALATLEYPTSSGSRLKLAYDYTKEILKRVRDANASTVFWEATSTDAFGHLQYESFGNGVVKNNDYDQASGLLELRTAGVGGTSLINYTATWDLNGNLLQRQDNQQNPSITETFVYDDLNRLVSSTRNGIDNQGVHLNSIGNILWKKDVCPTQSDCFTYDSVKKRAVITAGSNSYGYDANGNMSTRNGSSITYTSYNLPRIINSGSNSSTISYGAFRNRFKQVAVTAGVTETTIYVGGLLEKVTKAGVTEYRHLIHGGGGLAAIHARRTSGALLTETFYVHGDQLGSPELITKENGTVLAHLSFGAYGERRDKDWDGPVSSPDMTAIESATRQGFTGHEHLDSVGLIHMNGRVYDPIVGRFLGVDPIVGARNSQDATSLRRQPTRVGVAQRVVPDIGIRSRPSLDGRKIA